MKKTIRIATRESRLAMWQAEHVAAELCRHHPDLTVELVPMTTKGDQILDTTLAKIGGKGLFIKELETAMLEGRADIAVHSMKDVPAEMPEGFGIVAVLEREDPRDALVSADYMRIEDIPAGSVVGTSSLRRQAQLQHARPDLEVEPIRGNVETRLRKLDHGHFSAILLAAAGLKRLGLAERIAGFLPYEVSLPAVGQGAVGIEALQDDAAVAELVAPLEHADTRRCVDAERAFAGGLGASCESPVAGFAVIDGDELYLRGLVATRDGASVLHGERRGPAADAAAIGAALARDLFERGAAALLQEG
ncbi:hydroxymethylbilane synthase [Thioalkalivibrio sp. XN279]|uniref:hydroxymethylbilane synthase n=1 Tax=Thioalkalivibrio sp. XN279 TaxID=2714953 RepID=UPI001409645D|nr:hydroxymethylbilane synthase [Thioalkalivibrio sp. XN279]NHA13771.1 hydroxymethylbilane synthase [Thioalkalivibrio sp. XN279]